MPMGYVDHGPMMMPVTEPAYAAPDMSDYTLMTGQSHPSDPYGSDAAERALARRRLRVTIAATAVVVVIAAIGFTVAWQFTSEQPAATRSTPTEHVDAQDGADAAADAAFGPGGASADVMGTPPESNAIDDAASAGAHAAAHGAGVAAASDADVPLRAHIGPMAPPIAMGGGSNTSSYHDAPAVQPVSGGPAPARPSAPGHSAHAPAPSSVPHGGNGAAPGAIPTSQPVAVAHPVDAAAPQAHAQPVVTGAGATTGMTSATGAAQVIIALRTSAGGWQMYKTDPRRVVLPANAAGLDMRGAMSGLVWLSNAWQSAIILAQPVVSGAAGGGPGGAPMKH
jgi:hypothetical protein